LSHRQIYAINILIKKLIPNKEKTVATVCYRNNSLFNL
jgi:hypothetical protein